MADQQQEPPLGAGTGAPAPEAPPVWPPAARWGMAGLVALFLALLAWRGWGMSSWSARPLPIQRNAAPPHAIDLNAADLVDLQMVPGVGETLAWRIVEHRRQHGPFRSLDELRRVKGFGAATLERARQHLRVGPADETQAVVVRGARRDDPPPAGGRKKPPEVPVDVNRASAEELMRLPGIGPTLARRIVEARQQKGFASVEELRKVKGIGAKTLEKLRPHVQVGPRAE